MSNWQQYSEDDQERILDLLYQIVQIYPPEEDEWEPVALELAGIVSNQRQQSFLKHLKTMTNYNPDDPNYARNVGASFMVGDISGG